MVRTAKHADSYISCRKFTFFICISIIKSEDYWIFTSPFPLFFILKHEKRKLRYCHCALKGRVFFRECLHGAPRVFPRFAALVPMPLWHKPKVLHQQDFRSRLPFGFRHPPFSATSSADGRPCGAPVCRWAPGSRRRVSP